MKIAVILHLYYPDLWDWFVPYLRNVSVQFDLYVTLTDGNNNQNTIDKIKKQYPKSVIQILPNRGLDIAPFLYIMNMIISHGLVYDSVLKLHSKKSVLKKNVDGNHWRTVLVKGLLENSDKFRHYVNVNIHSNNLMIGSGSWVMKQTVSSFEQKFFTKKIPFPTYLFIGGTIFLINYRLLKDWMVQEDIYNRFYFEFRDGYISDGTLAHHIERVFGCLVQLKGGVILKS